MDCMLLRAYVGKTNNKSSVSGEDEGSVIESGKSSSAVYMKDLCSTVVPA